MALETLLNVKEIGGYGVYNKADIPISESAEWHQNYENSHPILINHDENTITFKMQNGIINVTGCQVDTLIHAAKEIIKGFDKKFPSQWNKNAIQHLWNAIHSLEDGRQERNELGVEEPSQAQGDCK